MHLFVINFNNKINKGMDDINFELHFCQNCSIFLTLCYNQEAVDFKNSYDYLTAITIIPCPVKQPWNTWIIKSIKSKLSSRLILEYQLDNLGYWCINTLRCPWSLLTLIPAWVNNCFRYKVCLTYSFTIFNGCIIGGWAWINISISHFSGHVITDTCLDWS